MCKFCKSSKMLLQWRRAACAEQCSGSKAAGVAISSRPWHSLAIWELMMVTAYWMEELMAVTLGWWPIYMSCPSLSTARVSASFFNGLLPYSEVTHRKHEKLTLSEIVFNSHRIVAFEIISAMATKLIVFLDVMPCDLIGTSRRFRGSC